MLPTVSTSSGGGIAAGGILMRGNTLSILVWSPSARARNAIPDSNANWNRSDDTVFFRGLKENINIRNAGNSVAAQAASWQWRRIVFSCKGLYQSLGTSVDSLFTSNGYVRLLADQQGTTFGDVLTSSLFVGVYNKDWIDAMTARIDRSKISVLYDRTRQLIPQSSASRIWNVKMWHGVNKNINYQNEENGGAGETASTRSVLSKPGIGDIYVIDMFQCSTADPADTLYFAPEATVYWHEK